MLNRLVLATLAAFIVVLSSPSLAEDAKPAEPKIAVLILDGICNWPHDWPKMTAWYKSQLEKSGRFTVDVATTPRWTAPQAEWDAWRPDFKKYGAVLSVYNG